VYSCNGSERNPKRAFFLFKAKSMRRIKVEISPTCAAEKIADPRFLRLYEDTVNYFNSLKLFTPKDRLLLCLYDPRSAKAAPSTPFQQQRSHRANQSIYQWFRLEDAPHLVET